MNKVALVTGSAKGIGRAIVKELAKNGYDVVINYNTSKSDALSLLKEVEALGVKALCIKADISNETEVKDMFDQIELEFQKLDILVNNAAVDLSGLYSTKTLDDFKKTLDVNLLGAYTCSKYAYNLMMQDMWGRIINISSTNGINTYYPMCLEYDASKAALISLTHNLAIQYAPYVHVNAIAPGFIGTEAELDGYTEDFLKEECDKILVNRFGLPEEVANLVAFLVSDKADYINNTVIRIDGGQYGSN